MNIEEIAGKAEPIEVNKQATPPVIGHRRAVSLYVGHASSQCFSGHIVEARLPMRFIHEFRVSGCSILHVADLPTVGTGLYAVKTCFVHAKQNPILRVYFLGDLRRTEEGYAGNVIVTHPGGETAQFWEIVYDE